jgi:catalase
VPFRIGNFQRDGSMAFYNQGSRPNYLSSIEPIRFKEATVDLDKVHGHFIGAAVSFLSEIRPEDFNAPRALWERVFDEGARQRLIKNMSGHMSTCRSEEAIKRMIGIFREVSEDMASRLEKATGVKGYPGIKGLSFNGTHNGMAEREELRVANRMDPEKSFHPTGNNGAPVYGTHKEFKEVNGKMELKTDGETNGTS